MHLPRSLFLQSKDRDRGHGLKAGRPGKRGDRIPQSAYPPRCEPGQEVRAGSRAVESRAGQRFRVKGRKSAEAI